MRHCWAPFVGGRRDCARHREGFGIDQVFAALSAIRAGLWILAAIAKPATPPASFAATYSLMRNRGGTCFDEAEAARLQELLPVIAASLRLHWNVSQNGEQAGGPAPDSEEVLRAAFSALTPAQQAVTKLILRGHSNISIAENLGITEGTVKLHRYNIYKRLEISSQAELFQRFIDFLGK
ncbi:helix-turn-helix transcriptional regulator [Paracoccus sp. SSJ]|uniref:helix-turn-helix transcriptional regulator n=1 Tax=Paracoccus sp. SSJ TaxID=3050636 RepID=UPI00254F648A|nr:helix-turn-helix transcriptional regulator [Paracoccus sp. SSJ]MDK8874353.1 helix-turn-helix transcriptional regulator [Paracoccus sp. SSJ]